ncbi:hypothetical protein [Dysgonomonas sp. 520]|uniref:hypothetical protein n=1 Tax=Dysgonomonas sp. 520 TaxID=2302931 RepID=UPI0013D19DA8|nr:hypothetical protein [Dysgonomonas sp. 520]NDW08101.1 hypothetical protein [Dysgonomonas sp. 520]
MKNKILLLMCIFPAFSFIQGQVVFYNKGLMSVVGQDTAKTILYVQGDMKVGTDATNTAITSNISMSKSKVRLTGDFYNDVKTGAVFKTATAGNEGVFEFKPLSTATREQRILTSKTTYTDIPSKATSYINFPHVKVENAKSVLVYPEIAMKTKDLILHKGWLVLDSKKAAANVDYPSGSTVDLINNRTVMAHLLVDGKAVYNGWELNGTPAATKELTAADWKYPANERGFVEVRLRLDDNNSAINIGAERPMFGFGVPYESMYADYFVYNNIMGPVHESFFGPGGKPIIDPITELTAGKGYISGIDIRGNQNPATYYWDINPIYSGVIDFDHRAKDGHYFNRFKFFGDNTRNKNFINKTLKHYQAEKLNVSNVPVTLDLGFNYLANPFMAPLDITELLSSSNAGPKGEWGIVPDNSGNLNRDILNRIWVLKGDAKGVAQTAYPYLKMTVTYNFYLAKGVGGTFTADNDDDGLASNVTIAPLQMFVVAATEKGKGKTMIIPKSKRLMSRAEFIRNTPTRRMDDFILEVVDNNTGMSDRTNVVLRPETDIYKSVTRKGNPEYQNVTKLNTEVASGGVAAKSALAEVTAADVKSSIYSQLYTIDQKTGGALTVNFLPDDTESVQVYMQPATEAQEITIRGLRLNTKEVVGTILLEDKIDRQTVELTPETRYVTNSSPMDPADRFVLHFKPKSGIDESDVDDRNIHAHYNEGTLTVSGFNAEDFGGYINLYSIQGALVLRTQIEQSVMEIPCSLVTGAYVLKTTGPKSYVTKLLAK